MRSRFRSGIIEGSDGESGVEDGGGGISTLEQSSESSVSISKHLNVYTIILQISRVETLILTMLKWVQTRL